MEVRLLGPVEVHADSGLLPVRGPIQRALVAMLAVHANRVVASQELLRGVWGPASRPLAGACSGRSGSCGGCSVPALIGWCTARPGTCCGWSRASWTWRGSRTLADQGRERSPQGMRRRPVGCWAPALALWRGRAIEDVRGAGPGRAGRPAGAAPPGGDRGPVEADLDAAAVTRWWPSWRGWWRRSRCGSGDGGS